MKFPAMLATPADILVRIAEHKRSELQHLAPQTDLWERQAKAHRLSRRPFAAALPPGPAIIAEIKQASPSKGILHDQFDPVQQALAYHRGGAAALSVLTDRRFFQGSLTHLEAARQAVPLPVLRKDFVIDPRQILEAAAHGADAILLIAALLPSATLRQFRELAATFAMDALVEVHDDAELDAALDSGATLIGVNNRDLRTFTIDTTLSERLAHRMPASATLVTESGFADPQQVRTLHHAGYHGFLVGEHLMRAADPAAALRLLLAPC